MNVAVILERALHTEVWRVPPGKRLRTDYVGGYDYRLNAGRRQ